MRNREDLELYNSFVKTSAPISLFSLDMVLKREEESFLKDF